MKISLNVTDGAHGRRVSLFGLKEGELFYEASGKLVKMKISEEGFDYANRFCFKIDKRPEGGLPSNISLYGDFSSIDDLSLFDVEEKQFNELFSNTPQATRLRQDVLKNVP